MTRLAAKKLHLNIIDKTLVRARNRGWARTTPVTQFGISTRNRRNPSKIWAFTSWSLAAESERQSLANHGNPLQSANWKLEYCRKQVEVGWSRLKSVRPEAQQRLLQCFSDKVEILPVKSAGRDEDFQGWRGGSSPLWNHVPKQQTNTNRYQVARHWFQIEYSEYRVNIVNYKRCEVEKSSLKAQVYTSGKFKSYRSGGSRISLRARSILITFIIFGNSSCIILAVVRSTLLLLSFHLHSLFFRSYLVSLQYFDDFYHIRQ